MKKLPNLDALRFFLALLVIIFHLPSLSKNQGLPYFNSLPIFQRGVDAVYMFFVLSGFLIIRIIYKDKILDKFSIKNFYVRRILRIFPLYYLIIFFGFVFYQVILPYLNITFENNYNLVDGILLTSFFLPNVFAFEYKPGGILEILWSIGIEEQFYLIIGVLMFFVNKKRIFNVLIILAFITFFAYHYFNASLYHKYMFVYFFLICGGVMAILEERDKLNALKSNMIYTFCILILTLLHFVTDLFEFGIPWLKNIFTCILFSLFIHIISCNNFKFSIKHKYINYLGRISYGIYMYHVIALNAIVFIFLQIKSKGIFNDTVTIILINILTFALTFILAHFSYKYYEKPFLKLKNNFRQ